MYIATFDAGPGDLGLAARIALAAVNLEWAKTVLWWTEKWNAFKGLFVDGWHDAVDGLSVKDTAANGRTPQSAPDHRTRVVSAIRRT